MEPPEAAQHLIGLGTVEHSCAQINARSHKSRATVDYTPISVEPHEPTRGVWPIVAVANDSQSHLVASSI